MSSDLEKFIRKNRGDFDGADPSNKVWKNIQQSLPVKKEEKHFTIRDIYKWSDAAAILFIALTSVYFLYIKKQYIQRIKGDVNIKAMIQNLQLQSELLGRQLMIINEYKTTKTSTNEKNI